MMTRKNIFRAAIAAIVLAVAATAASLASSATAYADVTTVGADSAAVPFRHTLKTNDAAILDGIAYSVNFAPMDSTAMDAVFASGWPEGSYAAPDIEPTQVTFTPAGVSADTPTAATSTRWAKVYDKSATLASIFGAANLSFPHAGVYCFRVTESVTGGTSGIAGVWDNSDAAYLMRVYVVNDDTTTLAYSCATIEPLTSAGALTGDKLSLASFESRYAASQPLYIDEETVGAYCPAARII